MSLDSAELEAFRDSAQDFLKREDQGKRIRGQGRDGAGLDHEFLARAAEAGWMSLLVPEEYGGLELGMAEVCVIAQEIGRTYIGDPVIPVAVETVTLLRALPEGDLRNRLLKDIASGQTIAGVAWQTAAGQLDPCAVFSAVASLNGFVFSGKYVAVSPLVGAAGWLVVASDDGEPILAWLQSDAQGISQQAQLQADAASQGELVLDSIIVVQANILARGSLVLSALANARDYARIANAAQLLGVARQAFDATLEYLNVRVQFGKPIASFQSIQHRMVDGYIQAQLLEYAIQQALVVIDADVCTLAMQASRLKVRAERAAGLITRLAVQMHGGMGYSDESDIGLGLKRAIGLSSEYGNARAHKRRYFQLLMKRRIEEGSGRDDGLVERSWNDFPIDADWNEMPDADFRSMLQAFFRKYYPDRLRHRMGRLHWNEIGDWYRTLSRQGWVAPAWPKEYGGMALSAEKMIAYIEEQERYGVGRPPDQGLVMLGPILFRYGTADQKARYLPKILSGEHVWAQGYSEPNAGSDLASLRCEALDDGDAFVVTGQKTWSTLAQDATHIFTLVRTDKTVKKQAGISFLLVDLSASGVSVRPIRTIAGDEEFCEVFFDQVRVPKSDLVGELNQGWAISKALLGFERLFSGSPKHSQNTLGMVDRIADATGAFECADFAADYTEIQIDLADLSAAYAAFSEIVRRNEPLPPNVSLMKIWATETHEKAALLLLDAAQESAASVGRVGFNHGTYVEDIPAPLYNAAAAKIFSGTNEIQRNILAKIVLGMPV